MSKWISVADKLPNHNEPVLCFTKHNHQLVVIFVDTKIMNEFIRSKGFEPVTNEVEKSYYFASQERQEEGLTLNGVTHWMPLPNSPKD